MKTINRRPSTNLSRALMAFFLAGFSGREAFAQTVRSTTASGRGSVGSYGPVAAQSGALGGVSMAPGLSATLSPMILAPTLLSVAPATMVPAPSAPMPSIAAARVVAAGAQIAAVPIKHSILVAAPSARGALDGINALSAAAVDDPAAGSRASAQGFDQASPSRQAGDGVPASKTNDLIDPRDLAPLLKYDKKTWTPAVSFHAHSRYSDGELTPTQLAQKLADAGLQDVALTDHDNVQGQEEFIRAAKALGLKAHTGIELTAGRGIHIVVLDLDIYDATLTALLKRIEVWRLVRAKAYVAHLNKLPALKDKGIVLTIEEVLAKTINGQIERPDIAEVLIDRGLVKNKDEAFKKFLGFDITDPEVLALEPKPEQVMEAVRSSGGRAFLAHPHTLKPGGPTASQLLALGMHGIEAYRPSKDVPPEELAKIQRGMRENLTLAHEMNLLVMPGADFHGPSVPHLNHPDVPMPRTLADQLLKALAEANRRAIEIVSKVLGI